MKRTLCVILSAVISLCCLPCPVLGAETAPTADFADVQDTDWFAPYVKVCVAEGLMQGTGEGQFSPGKYLTAAECLLLAVRLDRLLNGLEGPLPSAPENWGTVAITGEDGAALFGWEDYQGYRLSGGESIFCLPPERVAPLAGTAGTLTLNGEMSFEGQFVANEDPEAGWGQAGLAFQGLSYQKFEDILDACRLAEALTQTPEWLQDGFYYAWSEELGSGYLDALDVIPYPSTRLGFLTTLEGVIDPRELEVINTVETLPDAPPNSYVTWTNNGRSGTEGNFGAFYRAGVLSGTDEYGTFRGDLPLTRAEGAAMLARILRPELRLRFTLTPYPWTAQYTLTDLGLARADWWNSGDTNWLFPNTVEHPLDQQLLRVSPREGGDVDYGIDGIFTPDGTWLVEPGRYGDIGDFGPDGLARVSTTHNWYTGKWGVIDTQGRDVVEPIYDTIGLGGDGLIVTGTDDGPDYTVLDAQGKQVGRLPRTAAGSWGVREGLALYQDEETQLWGYLDLEGQVAIPARFEVAGLFYSGRAAVVLEGKLGYIDSAGALVIPCRYDPIGHYSEGHFQPNAAVAVVTGSDGLKWLIDKDGSPLSSRGYELLEENFSPNGFAFYQYVDMDAQAFGEGYLDLNGVEHPLPECDSGYQFMAFSGGCYLVGWLPGGGYNYMDAEGNILFPQWFGEATPLSEDGRAIVLGPEGNYCRLELQRRSKP